MRVRHSSRNQSFTGNLHSATTTTGPTAEDQRVRALEEELEEKRATTSQLQHELSITKERCVDRWYRDAPGQRAQLAPHVLSFRYSGLELLVAAACEKNEA